ncbi:putative lipase atg15, partial [Nowakowskiella sp. JEL0078]
MRKLAFKLATLIFFNLLLGVTAKKNLHAALSLKHVFHVGGSKFPGLLRRLDISPKTKDQFAASQATIPLDVKLKYGSFPHYISKHTLDAKQRIAVARSPDSSYDDWSVSKLLKHSPIKDTNSQTVDLRLQNSIDNDFEMQMEKEVGTWSTKAMKLPDETDPKTVLSLATMTYNTYYDPTKKSTHWIDMGGKWNESVGFGWESDGIRGYVFADERNEVMVITVKGTSAALFGI